jgi:hypothetical protein
MESLGQASIFHWTRRPDCTDRNMSIGYWQVSRIAAILGHAAEARRHGETCLAYSGALDPFYQGYAHEALARAALVACDAARAAEHLAKAEALLAEVTDKESRDLLTPDLAELRRGAG